MPDRPARRTPLVDPAYHHDACGVGFVAGARRSARNRGRVLPLDLAGRMRREVELRLRGSAGQSFGAFAGPGPSLSLTGQANDYVAKGLSGGTVVVRSEGSLLAHAGRLAIAGDTWLYGATTGRLHLVGRAAMRFAVRNSGARRSSTAPAPTPVPT